MVQHSTIDHTGIPGVGGPAAEFPTQNHKVATAQSTSSTSFADLATAGPTVTLTVGASGKVKLSFRAQANNTSATENYVGIVISGANTVAAATYIVIESSANKNASGDCVTLITGLSTGSTTFKMQYAVLAGTCTFEKRELLAEAVF